MLPTVQKGHRFLELDSLRGLAAMAVVLQHYRNTLGDACPRIFSVATRVFGGGRAAVILFFLLSGFVLTTSYMGPRRPTYPAFLLKRICRIYLPYAVAIILAALLAARYYSTIPTGNAWIDLTWNSPYSSHLLQQHLMMLGHYDSNKLNTAIWTLVIEMRVSVVFPVIAWVSFKAKPWIAVAACMGGTILLTYAANLKIVQAFGGVLFCAFFFVGGSVLRRHYREVHAVLAQTRWHTACAALIGFLCYQLGEFISFSRLGASPILELYLQGWVIGIGAALILVAATSSNRLRHLLHLKPALWCGARSYSIYLLHGTVLFFLIRRFDIQNRNWSYVGVMLLIVFAASETFYRLVEVPAVTLGRMAGKRSVPNNLSEIPLPEIVRQHAWVIAAEPSSHL